MHKVLLAVALTIAALLMSPTRQTSVPAISYPCDPAVYPSTPFPEHPESVSSAARAFCNFAEEYRQSHEARTIDRMNESWKGRAVTWQGRVSKVDASGSSFYMVPLSSDHCEAFVCDTDSAEINEGDVVTVRGNIVNVSVLDVIVSMKQ